MMPVKAFAAALAVPAVALALLVQVLPWAAYGDAGGVGLPDGARFEAHTWDARTADSGAHAWYGAGMDGAAGIAFLRSAIPLLVTGLALLGLGLAASGRPDATGAGLTLLGGLSFAAGTALFCVGLDLAGGSPDWKVAYGMAVAASVLGTASGVLGLAAGQGFGSKPQRAFD